MSRPLVDGREKIDCTEQEEYEKNTMKEWSSV